MRDDLWLKNKLNLLLENNFKDVRIVNEIVIRFGRRSKRRLGSIFLLNKKISVITISGYYRSEVIPEYVVIDTIAHELTHYTHGFSSLHKKKFAHPHRGGVIKNELKERSLYEDHLRSKEWIKQNWLKYLKQKTF